MKTFIIENEKLAVKIIDYGARIMSLYVKDADITLKLKTPSRVYEVSREDGEQRVLYDNVSELNISLINGGLGLYRIENADNEPSIIEYYLEKEYVPTTEKAPKASRAN